jgi:uncharacterized repeat protein (TIGR03803 family)
VIYNFGSDSETYLGPSLDASISQGRDGAIYSTGTLNSQTKTDGAFRIGPLGSFHTLHQWTGGGKPYSGLDLATDDKYYGINEVGGTDKLGTVFRMTASGGVSTLYNFPGGSGGAFGMSVMQSMEGDFYVSTSGGSYSGDDHGSILRMTKDGNVTLLHAFTGSDGTGPMVLVQGADFRFYGVTARGGSGNGGTIFRISSTGDFEVLYNFNANGAFPEAGLIQANDGNFYGTTSEGGSSNHGVLFRITPGGAYTVLHNFSGKADGGAPAGRLVQATDGNLYGANVFGGAEFNGVLYGATLAGAVVAIHNFSATDGVDAQAELMQHTNGRIYGSTSSGGEFNHGVFYSLDAGLAPFVTYLPVYGRAGAEVQILGQGFSDASRVSFNGIACNSVTVVSSTFLEAIVPAGATSGKITVTTSNGTLMSNKVFVVHAN